MDFGKWLRVEWDRAVAIGCMVLGALLLIVGWLGISRTPYPAEQLPLILSGGIGGVFLLGLGATFWLSADLRDEWSKLDSIDESLHELAGSSLVNGKAMSNGSVEQAPTKPGYADPEYADPGYAMASAPASSAERSTKRQRPLRASDAGVVRRRVVEDPDR
jgi:hypothetical protein